jgi:hypothetical protein
MSDILSAESIKTLCQLLEHNRQWEGLQDIDVEAYDQSIKTIRALSNEIETLRDENKRLEAALEKISCAVAIIPNGPVIDWQPIETAPRDGTQFLAWYPSSENEPAFTEVALWTPCPKGLNNDSWTIGGVDPVLWAAL